DDVEIIRTIHPSDTDQAEVIMNGDWNFVLIFENGQREIFNEIFKTMRAMNFSTENIVFANDFNSLLDNPAAVYALIKPEACDQLYRWINFFNGRRWHHYTTATAEGLHYVGTSADNFVICSMYMTNENHTAHELKLFHALSKKYYGIDDSSGYFLELGANIGTAGIYFCKKIAPNLKYIAFEPDAENFKLLHINTILNDLDDDSILVNFGLGEIFEEQQMYKNLSNPGGNGMFNKWLPSERNFPTETIKIIPLDVFFAENNLVAEDVKYIWIDTEGYEAQVLLGAKNLLTKNPAPIFMEFNPMAWNRTGYFERFVDLLKTVGYTHFIWILEMFQRKKEIIYPIDKLWDWKNSNNWIGSLGDIFLIKGALD
ncbi:MAG: FkbM family methyltransferase, partial [Selenomonadaceae bacterium]|nr:FkbM family methyltransferase [Selenomonadaceae bacterium]